MRMIVPIGNTKFISHDGLVRVPDSSGSVDIPGPSIDAALQAGFIPYPSDPRNHLLSLTSGEWRAAPGIFKLSLVGTGTVVLDSRNQAGVVTLQVESFTHGSMTEEIVFPYAGDDAVDIRLTFPSTLTVEILQ